MNDLICAKAKLEALRRRTGDISIRFENQVRMEVRAGNKRVPIYRGNVLDLVGVDEVVAYPDMDYATIMKILPLFTNGFSIAIDGIYMNQDKRLVYVSPFTPTTNVHIMELSAERDLTGAEAKEMTQLAVQLYAYYNNVTDSPVIVNKAAAGLKVSLSEEGYCAMTMLSDSLLERYEVMPELIEESDITSAKYVASLMVAVSSQRPYLDKQTLSTLDSIMNAITHLRNINLKINTETNQLNINGTEVPAWCLLVA